MSTGTRLSPQEAQQLVQEIQLVRHLIERCLQLYMNQKEVVETLLNQANIKPVLTESVWEQLEKDNQEFFKAYYIKLMVKHQIMEFNKLLEQQVHHMRQMEPTGVQSMNQKESFNASEHADQSLKSGSANHPMASHLSNLLLNGSSTLYTNVPSSVNISTHARRVDASPSMLSSQTTNMPMMQGMNGGMNGGMIKSESFLANLASYMHGGERNAHGGHPGVGNTLMPNFSSDPLLNADSSTFGFLGQIPRNFSLSDFAAGFPPDSSTFGFLGQIPRNFSLSDFTAGFPQSSGQIPRNYSLSDFAAGFHQSSDFLQSHDRSSFLVPSAENFLSSREREEYQGDSIHHI